MKALRIKEAYLLNGRLMIRSQITLRDNVLEIETKPAIKKTLNKVRGNPSVNELRELLRIKGTDIIRVNIGEIKRLSTYLLRKDRKDLKDLFESSDKKPYLILLNICSTTLNYRIILSYNDGIRLKKILSSFKNNKK